MDNKKDIGHNLGQTNSPKNQVVLRLFEKNNFFLFVYKKTERIVSALYLTSSLFSDSEPIKWQVREVGISVITRVLSLTANPQSGQEIVSRINADLLKLLSLLDIASSAGFVSEMNFSILKKELEKILETLISKLTPNEVGGSTEAQFDKEYFALSHDLFFPDKIQDGSNRPPLSGETVGVDRNFSTNLYDWAEVSRLEGVYKGHEKRTSSSVLENASIRKNYQHGIKQNVGRGEIVSDRELAVMKLLKDKNNLTIKDFSFVIKGCGEKTIQRELLRLVKLGVLKKSGERRWSRYSLSTPTT